MSGAKSRKCAVENWGRCYSGYMKIEWLTVVALAGTVIIAGCGNQSKSARTVSFESEVKPIFESRCIGCHQTGALLGRFNLESKELAFADGDGRVFIDPGNPAGSKVYIALTLPRDDEAAMPPEGHEVPVSDLETIRLWIEQGANWPDGEAGQLQKLPTD